MPRCKNCGAELNPGETSCAYCGTHVETPVSVPPPVIAVEEDQNFQEFVREEPRMPVMLSKVRLRSPRGVLKIAPVGYSWTTLFFGPFVCLCRRDWICGVIWLVLWLVCLANSPDTEELTVWDWALLGSHLVMSFIYNKIYIRSLYAKGYTPLGEDDTYTLRQKEII